jgi:hypothetical protein
MSFLTSVVGLVVFVFIAVLIASFCADDARRRGKSPILVVLICVFFFPQGLIAWLLFRPDPIAGPPRPFRLDDHRIQ